MNFKELTRDAKELLDLRPDGWTKDPLHDLAKLTEEAGEVAECMVKSHKTKRDLGDELSDVMIVAAVIALRADIDLTKACRRKQKERVDKLLKRFHGGEYPK